MIWNQHPHQTISKLLRLGLIIKPDTCQSCGMPYQLIAHHEDYFKPIDVCWVCKSCHNKRHAKIGHAKHHKEINEMFGVKSKRPKRMDNITPDFSHILIRRKRGRKVDC